jgi:hypothetical protein
MVTVMKILTACFAAIVAAAPALAVGVANDFNAQLSKMSSFQQRATLRRAVLDHNLYCDHIGPVAYQGPYKNLEMWVVKCDKGAAYGAFIGPDGTVQVRPCTDLVTLKLPACRIPK